jgi:hypothetical protein
MISHQNTARENLDSEDTKIFYIGRTGKGKPVPFDEFLKRIKKKRKRSQQKKTGKGMLSRDRGLTWTEMDELTGIDRVNSYVLRVSGGKPNSPPIDKFEQIVNALGYDLKYFSYENLGNGGNPEEYWETLREVGNEILRINKTTDKKQKLSSSFIKKIGGTSFRANKVKTVEGRKEIWEDLTSMDDGAFSDIEFQHMPQTRSGHRIATPEEKLAIEDSLLEYLEENNYIEGKFPRGTAEYVQTKLIEKGFKGRSTTSLGYHIRRIWSGERNRQEEPTRGSPSNVSIDDLAQDDVTDFGGLESIIDESIEGLTNEDDLVVKDDADGRKETYFEFSTYGHQALVAYLMDPENYRTLIGEDSRLIAVDFNQETTPEELYQKHIAKLECLDGLSEEDEEAIGFVDGWQRCDMIFKREDGSYVIAEIKQNAVNKEEFDNATKARQQLASYTAVVSDNIQEHNHRNQEPELKEEVEGVLVAFNIENTLNDYLTKTPNRRAIQVDREEVLAYAKGKIAKRPMPVTERLDQQEAEMSRLPKEDPRRIEYEKRRSNFHSFIREVGISSQENEGISIGTFDPNQGVVEFNGVLYRLNGSHRHTKYVDRLTKEDILERGKVNAMKYDEGDSVDI